MTVLATANLLRVLQSVATVRAPEIDVVPVYSSSVAGLTDNPTHGPTAQIDVVLTGSISGLSGSEVVEHIWTADGTAIPGADTDQYTPTAAQDLQVIRYAPTVDGVTVESNPATVRFAPPVAGSLTAVNATTGSVPTVNLTPGWLGDNLTYTEGVSWASISGSVLTLVDEVRTEILTITATNSGGAATVDLSVTIGAVDQTAGLDGLTINPTHGEVAQIGTVLTGTIDGLRGGETVVHRWKRNGSLISGENDVNYTPLPSDDLIGIRYSPTINGTILNSIQRLARYAPPIAGSLDPVVATVGNIPTVDLSAGFAGDDLTYTDDAAWTAISGSTLTIDDEERTDTANITATNSGGSETIPLSVTISAVAATPAILSHDIILSDTNASQTYTTSAVTLQGGAGRKLVVFVGAMQSGDTPVNDLTLTVNGVTIPVEGYFAHPGGAADPNSIVAVLDSPPAGSHAIDLSFLSNRRSCSVHYIEVENYNFAPASVVAREVTDQTLSSEVNASQVGSLVIGAMHVKGPSVPFIADADVTLLAADNKTPGDQTISDHSYTAGYHEATSTGLKTTTSTRNTGATTTFVGVELTPS